jgi:hypothetical protein
MYQSHTRDMSLVNLVASCQQKLVFSPTALLAVMGDKLGTDTRTDQLVCCGLGWKLFFLGALVLFKSIDDYVKGCYTFTM